MLSFAQSDIDTNLPLALPLFRHLDGDRSMVAKSAYFSGAIFVKVNFLLIVAALQEMLFQKKYDYASGGIQAIAWLLEI
ncbi:hypothetical protein KIN20_015403 [Parelaphostrongylus tenuis]|uniref:Uncharacterized protein n=1 Tax=Parelaphostrongylus tenuis TaxID=148309 RepID=A0AAD5QNZ7_PARTN|nr:hypothetical protein KIN20_015403 [Parelaphostrongylus tenuis]